jgi:diguanylate cyclase (GGDEF)-like protein
MKQMLGVENKYEKLKEEFETYQNFAESTIKMISDKNIKLEKKLDAITNIVEISKYINSNISDDNLIPMINDMILGILGVTYSSIYIKDKDKFLVKATNIKRHNCDFHKTKYYTVLDDSKPFIINYRDPKTNEKVCEKEDSRSIIGVPINLREKLIGYIVVEHTLLNFFSSDHINFILAIANQIGIALENNFLYKQIKENSIRDPLLGIYNRKYFFDVVERKIINNPNRRFAIVMLDIDDFKECNDAYGHIFGDQVLIETTKIIEENIDKNDLLARFGGEEIIIYIKDAYENSLVYQKIDNIRQKISENIIEYRGISGKVTASFGISYYPKCGQGLEEVTNAADEMLYKAKKYGKNNVVSY